VVSINVYHVLNYFDLSSSKHFVLILILILILHIFILFLGFRVLLPEVEILSEVVVLCSLNLFQYFVSFEDITGVFLMLPGESGHEEILPEFEARVEGIVSAVFDLSD
jgi:hypothetical protein